MTHPTTPPRLLQGLRLPRWLLPSDWPLAAGEPALADLWLDAQGAVERLAVHSAPVAGAWQLGGALALPGLLDAHTHLDKAFTLSRMGEVKPGLLGAIDAMMRDRQGWTADDVQRRAQRALQWSHEAGVVHLRTHCDWWEPERVPLAWGVLAELAQAWRGRIAVERVSLMPLHLFTDRSTAHALAAQVAASGPGALLGGFVHTTNWNPAALAHLLQAAAEHGLDVDLHVDEELNAEARGLATTARLLREIGFAGRVVCGHTCALSVQDSDFAQQTLDAVAAAPITLVALPVTNLLLQDAQTARTPRLRGLTLVKEARSRGIPLLMASDNVQDPFCPMGSFDPLEALALGVPAAQLDQAFDVWSAALCRRDWLQAAPGALPLSPGDPADLLIFTAADRWSFPSRSGPRVVLRQGRVAHGAVPGAWLTEPAQPRSAA